MVAGRWRETWASPGEMALKHLGICAGLQLGDPRGVRNLLGRSGGHPGIVDHGPPLPLGSSRPWPTGAHSQCGDPGRAGESSGGRWTQWHGLWAGPFRRAGH